MKTRATWTYGWGWLVFAGVCVVAYIVWGAVTGAWW